MSVHQDVTQLHKHAPSAGLSSTSLNAEILCQCLQDRWKSLVAFPFGGLKIMAASVRKTSQKTDGIKFLKLILCEIRVLCNQMTIVDISDEDTLPATSMKLTVVTVGIVLESKTVSALSRWVNPEKQLGIELNYYSLGFMSRLLLKYSPIPTHSPLTHLVQGILRRQAT